MAITRSNVKKTPPRNIRTGAPPLAPSRNGGQRTTHHVAGRNLLGAFTAALTPCTPVRRCPVLRGPPAIRRKGSRPSHRVAGRILFAETPEKASSARTAPHAPLKAAPETPIAWITRMGQIWDSVMLSPLTA